MNEKENLNNSRRLKIFGFLAYRSSKKALQKRKESRKKADAKKRNYESWSNALAKEGKILDPSQKLCSSDNNNFNCPFWYALEHKDGLKHKVSLQNLNKDLQWHKENNVSIQPRDNNWKESLTVITTMAYKKGDEYTKLLASKNTSIKLVFDSIDYSKWEDAYLENCGAIAEHLASKSKSYHSRIFNKRSEYRSIIKNIWEEEGKDLSHVTERDYLDNIPGLYMYHRN
jgi:hypothetical protein